MCKKWEVSITAYILILKFFYESCIIIDLINVEIFSENDYPASLNVSEDPLTLGGGWSEKMSSLIIGGGGHGHALVRYIYIQFF